VVEQWRRVVFGGLHRFPRRVPLVLCYGDMANHSVGDVNALYAVDRFEVVDGPHGLGGSITPACAR